MPVWYQYKAPVSSPPGSVNKLFSKHLEHTSKVQTQVLFMTCSHHVKSLAYLLSLQHAPLPQVSLSSQAAITVSTAWRHRYPDRIKTGL